MGQSPKDSSSWSANEGRAKLKAEGEKLSASAEKRARRAEIGETEVNGGSYGEGVERKESPLTGVEDLVSVAVGWAIKPGREVEEGLAGDSSTETALDELFPSSLKVLLVLIL